MPRVQQAWALATRAWRRLLPRAAAAEAAVAAAAAAAAAAAKVDKQIELDLPRTFPEHATFASEEGQAALRRVLRAKLGAMPRPATTHAQCLPRAGDAAARRIHGRSKCRVEAISIRLVAVADEQREATRVGAAERSLPKQQR